MDNIQIIPMQTKDDKVIIDIMNILSNYFSPETIEFAEEKVSHLTWFIAKDQDTIIWFITFEATTKNKAKIYWMGIVPEYQHQWIGGMLLQYAEDALLKQWIKEIELLTLDEHPDYPGYFFTREFYKKHDFVVTGFEMADDVKILTMTKIIS